MIKLLILLLLIPPLTFAKGNKSKVKIRKTEVNNNDLILQSEINAYQGATYDNLLLNYSSISGIDLGILSQNIPLSGDGAQNFQADTYLVASYQHRFFDAVLSTVGGQYGYQLDEPGVGKAHQFYFQDNEFRLASWLKLHSGLFWVNESLSTTTSYIGGMAGYELIYKDVSFEGDYFGGHSNISGAQVVMNYYPYQFLKLYSGVGIPETKSGNEWYGVFGFQVSTGSLR